jgi:hypothetical protein
MASAAYAQATAPATWTEVPLLNRRQQAAMATLRNKVVLFGGSTTGEFGDTWEWN